MTKTIELNEQQIALIQVLLLNTINHPLCDNTTKEVVAQITSKIDEE